MYTETCTGFGFYVSDLASLHLTHLKKKILKQLVNSAKFDEIITRIGLQFENEMPQCAIVVNDKGKKDYFIYIPNKEAPNYTLSQGCRMLNKSTRTMLYKAVSCMTDEEIKAVDPKRPLNDIVFEMYKLIDKIRVRPIVCNDEVKPINK